MFMLGVGHVYRFQSATAATDESSENANDAAQWEYEGSKVPLRARLYGKNANLKNYPTVDNFS